MTAFAITFAASAGTLGVAVVRAQLRVARAAAALCVLSYLGFFALLIAGGIRA